MASVENDLVTAFTIRELTGDKRTLKLRDRALPYRPLELSGSHRHTIDWYPGSPVGTLQAFGSKEEPTTISGYWKDVFLYSKERGNAAAEVTQNQDAPGGGDEGFAELMSELAAQGLTSEFSETVSRALPTVRELVALVDDMRRKGQEVEVTWLDQVRRGMIDRFTTKWHTGHDAEWELAFVWSSKGEDLNDVAMVDDTALDLADLPGLLQAELDDAVLNAAELVQSATDRGSGVLELLDEVSARLQDAVDQLSDAIVAVGDVLQTPNNAMRRVTGILDGIKLEAETLVSVIEDIADGVSLDAGMAEQEGWNTLGEGIVEAVVSGADIFGPGQITFGTTLAVRAEGRDRSAAATRLRNLAARRQQTLLRRVTSTIVASFQAREGQDLRQVAQRFYGSADAWRGLMTYNGLQSSGLRAGQIILVPAQPPTGGC